MLNPRSQIGHKCFFLCWELEALLDVVVEVEEAVVAGDSGLGVWCSSVGGEVDWGW